MEATRRINKTTFHKTENMILCEGEWGDSGQSPTSSALHFIGLVPISAAARRALKFVMSCMRGNHGMVA